MEENIKIKLTIYSIIPINNYYKAFIVYPEAYFATSLLPIAFH